VTYSGGRGSGRVGSLLEGGFARGIGQEPVSLFPTGDAGDFPRFMELRCQSFRRKRTRVAPI
jgi:hypothetical protein